MTILCLLCHYYVTIIRIKRFMSIILIISIISQVRVDLGIPEHFWQEQRAVIASSIDGLGDRFSLVQT